MATPCKLRRSTQWQLDCKWCGSSCQEYGDKVCDQCNVKYGLRLYFESFGHHGLRVFGDFSKDKDWFDTVSKRFIFNKLFAQKLGGRLDSTSLGWVFEDSDTRDISEIRGELVKLEIFNWYSSSELSARIQQESEFDVDI